MVCSSSTYKCPHAFLNISKHLSKARYLQVLIPENPYGFWWTRILVRVPKITLSCGHCDFRLTTENHNDFLVTKIGKNGDVDVEIQNSRILIQKQRTQKRDESHNDTRQQRLFCLRGNSRSWP